MASNYELRVSAVIQAPVGEVRAFLVDLANFSQWNPFLVMDPETSIKVSQPSTGVGASYSWVSKRIGSGVMTIRAASEAVIDIHMRFTSRNKREDAVQWILTEHEGGTTVTWVMSGHRTLIERVFVGLMRLDAMMSKHFADGFQRLKAVLEK